jgi:hypothetical protein
MFIMLRIIEFIETVMFVLRKKQNQVSPLHVYHHISTVCLLWVFFNYHPSKFDQNLMSQFRVNFYFFFQLRALWQFTFVSSTRVFTSSCTRTTS